eukprot:Tamp_18939.p1 GENE.Tamp_18939~~Tamp_18939.p1  ORF type:complete len:379 (-),score=65.17 Tamp_18939:123-1259(-)
MLPVLALLAVNTLVPQRVAAMAATRLVAQPWHGPGAEQWRKMAGIVPRAYLCRRVDPAKPVSLADADIRTAEAWAHAPWTDEFVDIEGDQKPRPCWQTRAKMLWDDDALYVGAWMEEPQVVATLREQNSVIFHDNDFEVFIDAAASNHNYYEFEVNALNTRWELRLDKPYKNGGSEHSERVGMSGQGSLPHLQSSVFVDGALNDPSVTDTGWGVVVKFPFRDLLAAGHCASPPAPGECWRINMSRVQWLWAHRGGEWLKVSRQGHGNECVWGEDNWCWCPQGLINMHLPERWGFVRFTTYARPPEEGEEAEEEEDAASFLTASVLELRTRRRPRWWSACMWLIHTHLRSQSACSNGVMAPSPCAEFVAAEGSLEEEAR